VFLEQVSDQVSLPGQSSDHRREEMGLLYLEV
jgi:hypothetical protein